MCTRCWSAEEIIARRYYTVFTADFYTVAGTCEKIGPFKLCDLVFPNIRVFKRWVRERQRVRAEETRVYFEQERQRQALLPPPLKVDDESPF